MAEDKITELQSGFNTAFINSAFNSNLAYRPQFIYNDNPVFDTFLLKKVSQAALGAVCGTFINFTDARYTIYFLVWEQIFLIFAMGTICLDVQNPNASCSASVSSVLV